MKFLQDSRFYFISFIGDVASMLLIIYIAFDGDNISQLEIYVFVPVLFLIIILLIFNFIKSERIIPKEYISIAFLFFVGFWVFCFSLVLYSIKIRSNDLTGNNTVAKRIVGYAMNSNSIEWSFAYMLLGFLCLFAVFCFCLYLYLFYYRCSTKDSWGRISKYRIFPGAFSTLVLSTFSIIFGFQLNNFLIVDNDRIKNQINIEFITFSAEEVYFVEACRMQYILNSGKFYMTSRIDKPLNVDDMKIVRDHDYYKRTYESKISEMSFPAWMSLNLEDIGERYLINCVVSQGYINTGNTSVFPADTSFQKLLKHKNLNMSNFNRDEFFEKYEIVRLNLREGSLIWEALLKIAGLAFLLILVFFALYFVNEFSYRNYIKKNKFKINLS